MSSEALLTKPSSRCEAASMLQVVIVCSVFLPLDATIGIEPSGIAVGARTIIDNLELPFLSFRLLVPTLHCESLSCRVTRQTKYYCHDAAQNGRWARGCIEVPKATSLL